MTDKAKASVVIADALYVEVRPGDATIYRGFIRETGRDGEFWMAMGVGDYIYGGYILATANLIGMAKNLLIAASEGKDLYDWVTCYHHAQYWASKFNLRGGQKSGWESVVPLLVGMIYVVGDLRRAEHMQLISDIYYGRNTAAMDALFKMEIVT